MKSLRTRYVPTDSSPITITGVDAVVYIYGQIKPTAIAYRGKATKPVFHYSFRDEERRQKAIADFFDGIRASEKLKAETKAKRLQPAALVSGDILISSWGYDQTNVDFYQVTAVKGRYVEIRPIAQTASTQKWEARSDAEYVEPFPYNFTGPAERKLVQWGESVTLTSYSSARKWDGKPRYQSHYA